MGISNYSIWRASYMEGYCVIQSPEGVKKAYQLNKGVSRSKDWPKNIICVMDPDFPHDIQLSDNLYGAGFKVISKPIKDALIMEGIKNVEFLPATIRNHKGRVASKDYYIMNPLDVIDCIDITTSDVRWNAINNEIIDSCRQLVLNEKNISNDNLVFRPKYLPKEIMIINRAKKAIERFDFTGLYFIDPSQFTGG